MDLIRAFEEVVVRSLFFNLFVVGSEYGGFETVGVPFGFDEVVHLLDHGVDFGWVGEGWDFEESVLVEVLASFGWVG